jgi:hypothetical protein
MNISVIIPENFTINDKICISLNNNINYNKINIDILKNSFIQETSKLINKYNIEDLGLIILVDYKKIDFNNISLKRAKCIINLMMEHFPNKLHKCIFYNTNKTFSTFISLIKVFLDKITADKIITKKNISDIISQIKDNSNIIQINNN